MKLQYCLFLDFKFFVEFTKILCEIVLATNKAL